jgi:hypothetical protein
LSTSGTGPDGNTSYQVTETTANASHTLANSGGTTATSATSVSSGVVYTGSIFLKKVTGSVDWVQVTLGSVGFGTTQYANFNIGNGTVGNSAGLASGTSPRIENYGNGWYRCSISVAASATTSTSFGTVIGGINNTNGTTRLPAYTGSTSNQFLAAMGQFEVGSFATSYIPTTTGSVVRSADVCSYSDVSSFYNPAAGTLVGDLILYTPSPSVTPELFRFGGGNNRIQLGVTNTANEAIRPFIISGGTQTYSSTQGTTVAGASRKVALTFATNDAISCFNGTLGTQDTSVTMPISISTATIGAGALTGHIAAIRYYRKRLSNQKLQALTA